MTPPADSNQSVSGCEVCMPPDAKQAWESSKNLKRMQQLVHDSHFWVSLHRCPACGQRFVFIFTELIDWDQGDDSQAFMHVPVTEEEASKLRTLDPDHIGSKTIMDLLGPRRYLEEILPTRSGPDPDWPVSDDDHCCRGVRWSEGPVFVLPHD
ncbi:MAG: hypothetical protein IT445_13485 [Phycisphaeraceae bacterium]|nr:hypothetical protein [Phycisphaeraceae bacterium]